MVYGFHMNFFLLLFVFVSSAFAQDYAEILHFRGRSLGHNPTAQITKTREILAAVQKVAQEQGTVTEAKNLTDNAGNSYPVLVISPVRGNVFNEEAERVSRQFSGLPLVFSPYDLGRSGANAFFDPAGKMLGVSYDFVLGNSKHSSYVHELYHASTYQKVLAGKNPLWAGVMRAVKGHYISSKNTEYYHRFVSLDELPATALSLRLDTSSLLEMKRTQTPQEFNRSRGVADSLLNEVYFSAKVGRYLARQVQDVLTRALNAQGKIQNLALTIGQTTKSLPTMTYLLDSYSEPTSGARSSLIAESLGSDIRIYSSTNPTPANFKKRLTTLIERARQSEAAFELAEKCVYILIEYPRIEKTDFGCLEREAAKPFSLLDTI